MLHAAGGREDPQGEVPGEDEGGEGGAALGVAGARRIQLHSLRVQGADSCYRVTILVGKNLRQRRFGIFHHPVWVAIHVVGAH